MDLEARFATLTTAHLADACIRAGLPVRCAPAPTRAVVPGSRLCGPAVPARHVGSVDVFLEAFEDAPEGGVLMVDNGGRLEESCVGDLVVLEARAARLSGVVIWGLHRDTADIRAIGLPVFSLGSIRPDRWASGRASTAGWPKRSSAPGGSGRRTSCWATTTASSSSRSPARVSSSRWRRESATPSVARPTGSVEGSRCAVRSGSVNSLPRGNRIRH